MIGCPIAVVRVGLDLQPSAAPVTDQGRTADQRNPATSSEQTPAFEEIEFPIRLGENKQLNDGLVGYWEESENEALGQQFYSSQGFQPPVADPDIVTNSSDIPPIRLSLNSPPRNVILLMNPGGTVHAATGSLPVESIKLPVEHYVEAVQAISQIYFAVPLLSSTSAPGLPLPKEADFTWQWQEKRTGQWQ